MQILIALACGTLFGAGLTVSQMTNPQKLLNFLDLWSIRAGNWDPTMAMVFLGALPVMALAYVWRTRMPVPMVGVGWSRPEDDAIDTRLVVGSSLFGIGWGLAGLCPGPAVASLALLSHQLWGSGVVFVGALLTGVWLANITRLSGSAGQPAEAV